MKVVVLTIITLFVAFGLNLATISKAETVVRSVDLSSVDAVSAKSTTGELQLLKGISVKAKPQTESVVDNFSIQIGKIGLDRKIVANVNPAIKDVYLPIIDQYVAHGKYTKLPSQAIESGNVYLYAHRRGPAGFFGRLNELKKGDPIEVNFNSKTYKYKVSTSFVVSKTDTWVYTGVSDLPTLTLQTCENGNQDRLIVKARLINVI